MAVTKQHHINAPLKASSEIKHSEHHLQTIIDAIPTLAWCCRADGSAEFFNQRWREHTGMSEEEACGWGWTRAIHPEDIDRVLDQWRTIVASAAPGELEARLRRSDGAYRWFIFRATPSLDDQGRVVNWYGTHTDIEDRKRAEEALRASEQNLRLIVDSIPGFVCTMSAAGEVEFVNQGILDYLGMTVEELSNWHLSIHEDDRARVLDQWSRSVESGCPYDIEHRIRRADGAYRWFHVRGRALRDTEGRVVRWYMLLADIEDRKRAEDTLKDSERALRLLFESIPGMIAVSGPDGNLEYVNRRLIDFGGVELEQVTTFGWAQVLHPDDADAAVNKWLHALATSQPMDATFRIRRADGTYRWFDSRTEPLFNDRGRVVRWYGLLWDIEDRKNAEEALRTIHAELAHVTRLMTMGELTASIAHEVNQPLAAVVNNAYACLGLLPNATPHLQDVRDALGEIVDDAYRASAVIARVRQLARKAPSESTSLNLRDVVADVLALARHESATRRVTLRTELPDELPPVLGDRVQLQQVLLNLVVNGMDAMSTVEESKRVLTICGRCETREGMPHAVLRVQDAGIGVPPEEIDRLFEAFYTTKPQGMGMGLAISRSIIAAHGGRLWAEPNHGPGVTFVLSLPEAVNPAS